MSDFTTAKDLRDGEPVDEASAKLDGATTNAAPLNEAHPTPVDADDGAFDSAPAAAQVDVVEHKGASRAEESPATGDTALGAAEELLGERPQETGSLDDSPEDLVDDTLPPPPQPEPPAAPDVTINDLSELANRDPSEIPVSSFPDEEVSHALSTGCEPLDKLLDGGLEKDAITLVFGEGGSGKTNLALQCARNVTAAGKKVAYVDTEGVSGIRLQQIFGADAGANPDNILLFTPYTIEEQERMVEKTALLQGVGLIVIDSINMHYRLHIEDKSKQSEAGASLYKQLHHLTGHARKHNIPVLVTGQVYGGEDDTQPFARRTMEHLVKALVRFQKKPDGGRKATVLKHRSIEEGRTARFKIGPHGLEAR